MFTYGIVTWDSRHRNPLSDFEEHLKHYSEQDYRMAFLQTIEVQSTSKQIEDGLDEHGQVLIAVMEREISDEAMYGRSITQDDLRGI